MKNNFKKNRVLRLLGNDAFSATFYQIALPRNKRAPTRIKFGTGTHSSSVTPEDIHLIQKRLLWALAIGHWEAIVWRSLKQSISLFSYAQTIASQCPTANAQSNLF